MDRQREELHGHHLRGPSSDRSAGAPTPQPSHRECPPSNSEPDDRVPCHIYLQGGETGGEDGRNERFTDCRRVTVAMSSPPRWFAFLPGFSALQAAARSVHAERVDLSHFYGTYLVPCHSSHWCRCHQGYQGCPVAGALRRAAQPAGRGRSARRQGRGWLRARGGPVCLVPARPGREQRLMKRVARTRIVTNRNRGRAKPGPERRRPYWQQQL